MLGRSCLEMIRRLSKGFSYDPIYEKEVIEYIDRQRNKSQYIWNLVREDMEKAKTAKTVETVEKAKITEINIDDDILNSILNM